MSPCRSASPRTSTSLATCLCAALAAPAGAQTDSTRQDANVWLVYNGQHAWSARWALLADAQLRRADGGARPRQLLLRPGLRYAWTSRVAFGAGYAFIRTSPGGLLADPIPTREHRAWEQVEVETPAGRTGLTHRLRLEQRWQERVTSGVPGPPRVAGWSYQDRLRYQLRGTWPLHGGAPQAPGWYAAATEEAFVRRGGGVANRFDQNRVFVGLGYRWRAAWRLEGGYLNQYARAERGRARATSHVLQVALVSALPLGAEGR